MSYYSKHGVCLPKLFTTTTDLNWSYPFFIMMFDFATFLYIMGSYILTYKVRLPIFIQISTRSMITKTFCSFSLSSMIPIYPALRITLVLILFEFSLNLFLFQFSAGRTPTRNKKSRANNVLQKKIARLIVVDFCCWVPVCTSGKHLSTYVLL